MNCITLTSGYALQCRDNIGGVRRVLIGNFDAATTYTPTTATGEITLTDIAGAKASYYVFEQEQESASFNQSATISTENGTIFYTQDAGLILQKNTEELRDTLIALVQGSLSVIVEDQRGVYWLLGKENGVRAVSGAMSTGKAFGDLNGVTIGLQGKEPYPAQIIAETAFDIAV